MIIKKQQRQITSLPQLPVLAHSFLKEKQTNSLDLKFTLQKKRMDSLQLSHRISAHQSEQNIHIVGQSEIGKRPRKMSMHRESIDVSNFQNNLQLLPPIYKSVPQISDETFQFQDQNKHPFRNLIFSPVINEMVLRKHLLIVQKGLQYSKRHLRGPSDSLLKSMSVTVHRDKRSKKKSLFLDLDETLIHSCTTSDNPDVLVEFIDDTGKQSQIPIKIRPHCQEFIKTTSQYYDIYIFTASSLNYASGIIYFLDPQALYIKAFFCRDYCMETKNGLYIKDLRIFENLNLQDIILVDNLSHSFGLQLYNGIPILEWRSDKSDQELVYLANYLKDASRVNDVREYNKQQLKLNELINFIIEQ